MGLQPEWILVGLVIGWVIGAPLAEYLIGVSEFHDWLWPFH